MESEEVYIRLDGDDDDEEVINECDTWPIYCNEYISSLKTLPILELAGIKEVSEDRLCKSVPQIEVTGDARHVSFMLDHSYVPAGDASTDNLGVWNNRKHRMASRLFYLKGDEQCDEEECEYVIRRRFYNHANAQPFGSVRKMVWMLYRRDGIAYRSLISYRIDEGGAIISTAHGNAKISQRLYRRTYPSTLQRMKELRKTLAPRQVLSAMIAEQGGVSSAVNRQALPRDKSQLYNLSRCKPRESHSQSASSRNNRNGMMAVNDPSTTLQDLFRTVGNNGFVRAASHGVDGDCVFFATDMMVESFKVSCAMNVDELEKEIAAFTPPSNIDNEYLYKYFHDFGRVQMSQHGHSPVVIHRSHELTTDVHILVIAFQNKTSAVNLNTHNSALSVAAFALCTKTETESYVNAARFLLSSIGFDEDLRVRSLISDMNESAIITTSCQLFAPPTIHVQCGLHLAENTERKLIEIGVDVEGRRSIMRDIYGIDSPLATYRHEGGLVDSVSVSQFESCCADLMEKWRLIAPSFPSFFATYQKDAIKRGYLLPLRLAAGVDIGFIGANDIRHLDTMVKDAFRDMTANFGAQDIIDTLYRCATGESMTFRFGLSTKRSHSQKRSRNDTRETSFALKRRQQLVTKRLSDDDVDIRDDREDLEISMAVQHLNSAGESYRAIDCARNFLDRKLANLSSSRRKTYLKMDASDEDSFLRSPSSSVDMSPSQSSGRSVLNRSVMAAVSPVSCRPVRFLPVNDLLPSQELVRAAWQTSNRVFTRPFHNQNHFCINFYSELQTEESMCVSCGVDFPKHAPAPEDVVILHEERYSLPDGSFTDKATQNRVLHCRLTCILSRYPYFTVPEFLAIEPSVLERLTEKHERHILQQFGDFLFMARWKVS